MMLAMYMSNCSPFIEPSQLPPQTQGDEWKDGFSEAYDDANKETREFTVTEEFQDYQDIFDQEAPTTINTVAADTTTNPLPMFHMPESTDVLDYLSSIESNMKEKNAKLDAQEDLKALRLRKVKILQAASYHTRKPRFYATHNRNIHQRLRRYQQKWNLK